MYCNNQRIHQHCSDYPYTVTKQTALPTHQKAVSTWKLMLSRTCSGAFSSMKSMIKMRWYGSCWNSVCLTSWSCRSTPATMPSTYRGRHSGDYSQQTHSDDQLFAGLGREQQSAPYSRLELHAFRTLLVSEQEVNH